MISMSIPFLKPTIHHTRFSKTTTNAYNGATFGLKPTLSQSNYYRPHNKFAYAEGLYFVAAAPHPGAGVPIVMQSAKACRRGVTKR